MQQSGAKGIQEHACRVGKGDRLGIVQETEILPD